MVMHEGFNITLCKRGTDASYAELHNGGKSYVVAVPNQEFTIQIVAPDNLADICKDGLEALFNITIDGKSVGYGKFIRAGQKAVFDGFLSGRETVKESEHQATKTKTVYRNFKFASTLDASSSLQTASSHLGEIKVSLRLGFREKVMLESFHQDIEVASSEAPQDGKKFFLAPSLCTRPGTTESREEGAWTSFCIEKTPWEVKLHYETAATLLLRKVLNPANQAHAAIIALNEELNGGRQVKKENGGLPHMKGSSCSSRAQPSRNVRVKREADGKGPERPEQVCVVDEDLVCDLTGINAKWEVRKKPRAEGSHLV